MDNDRIDPTITVKIYNIFDPEMKIFIASELKDFVKKEEDLQWLTGDLRPDCYISENGDYHFKFNNQDYWIPKKGNPDLAGIVYNGPFCYFAANIAEHAANHMVDIALMIKEQYDDIAEKSKEKVRVKGGRTLGNSADLLPSRMKYKRMILPILGTKVATSKEEEQRESLKRQILAAKEQEDSASGFEGLNEK